MTDTSKVSFGSRHEGTGMVLLQHADLRGWWGFKGETVEYHRDTPFLAPEYRAAHAALAEVREAFDTAEAAGVDVYEFYGVVEVRCVYSGPLADQAKALGAARRAHRYLAREVQALVAQGLRGDDLNARVRYRVTDHRAPVKTVGPDDDVERGLLLALTDERYSKLTRLAANRALAELDAERAARTSEDQL